VSLPLPASNLPSTTLWRSGYMPTNGRPTNVHFMWDNMANYTGCVLKVYGTNYPGPDYDPTLNHAYTIQSTTINSASNKNAEGLTNIATSNVGNTVDFAYIYIEIQTAGNAASGDIYISAAMNKGN
jgi:hypothetical protein